MEGVKRMECIVKKLNVDAQMILQNEDGYLIVYNNEVMFQSANTKIAIDAPNIEELEAVDVEGVRYQAVILGGRCVVNSIRSIRAIHSEQEILEAYKNNSFVEVEDLHTDDVIEMIHVRKKLLS